jgi:hypothetical protein
VNGWPLDDADRIAVVSGRFGSISLYGLRDPVGILAVARGAISFRMILQDLEHVSAFARDHADGWCYLGDVRRVRLLNPRNVVALRRIATLPGVRRQVIVVPRLARWLQPLAAGELTTSVADALDRCRKTAR